MEISLGVLIALAIVGFFAAALLGAVVTLFWLGRKPASADAELIERLNGWVDLGHYYATGEPAPDEVFAFASLGVGRPFTGNHVHLCYVDCVTIGITGEWIDLRLNRSERGLRQSGTHPSLRIPLGDLTLVEGGDRSGPSDAVTVEVIDERLVFFGEPGEALRRALAT